MEKLADGGASSGHVLRAPSCIIIDGGQSGLLIHPLKVSLYLEFQMQINHRTGLVLVLNGVRRLHDKRWRAWTLKSCRPGFEPQLHVNLAAYWVSKETQFPHESDDEIRDAALVIPLHKGY